MDPATFPCVSLKCVQDGFVSSIVSEFSQGTCDPHVFSLVSSHNIDIFLKDIFGLHESFHLHFHAWFSGHLRHQG